MWLPTRPPTRHPTHAPHTRLSGESRKPRNPNYQEQPGRHQPNCSSHPYRLSGESRNPRNPNSPRTPGPLQPNGNSHPSPSFQRNPERSKGQSPVKMTLPTSREVGNSFFLIHHPGNNLRDNSCTGTTLPGVHTRLIPRCGKRGRRYRETCRPAPRRNTRWTAV